MVYSINDAGFVLSAGMPEWIDYPSTLHNMGCVFAFGDGHTELHHWVDPSTKLTAPPTGTRPAPNSPDWRWMADRTTARAQ